MKGWLLLTHTIVLVILKILGGNLIQIWVLETSCWWPCEEWICVVVNMFHLPSRSPPHTPAALGWEDPPVWTVSASSSTFLLLGRFSQQGAPAGGGGKERRPRFQALTPCRVSVYKLAAPLRKSHWALGLADLTSSQCFPTSLLTCVQILLFI